MIDEAGAQGVQICATEIFNGPYRPSQDLVGTRLPSDPADDSHHAGVCQETSDGDRRTFVRRSHAGSYYNSAWSLMQMGLPWQVSKIHIPQTVARKVLFKPGDGGYPVFETRYARVGVYIATTVTFRRSTLPRPQRSRDRF